MVAKVGGGLALCVELAHADVAAAARAAAIATTAASAAWLAVPGLSSRSWVAHADALEPPGASLARADPSSKGACPLGYGSGQRGTEGYDYRQLKTYTFQLKTISSVFDPWNLIKIYLKNVALVALINVNVWLWDMMDAEEKALQEGTEAELPPFPPLQPLVTKSNWSALREVLTLGVRRCYEHAVALHMPARWAWKYLKDYRASLQRKALFYSSMWRLRRIPMYASTIARATAVPYAADWTVSVGYLTAEALRSKDAPQARARKWAAALGRQTLRTLATWSLVAAATAGVIALIPDKYVCQGSGYCHFLFDLIISNVMWGLMELEGGFGNLGSLLPGAGGAGRPEHSRGSFMDDGGAAAGDEGTLGSDVDIGGLLATS